MAWQSIIRSRLLYRGLLIMAWAFAIGMVLYWFPRQWERTDIDRDIPLYYMAAKAVRENRPLYYDKPGLGPREFWSVFQQRYPTHAYWYFYAPHFAVAISPLARLSYVGFCRVWYLILFASFWLYAVCLCRLATGRLSLSGILIAGLLIGISPGTKYSMGLGNVDPLLYALFGLALAANRRGVPLALGMLIKPYFLYFLALAAYREGRKVYVPAVAVIIAALTSGILACGFHSYMDWARYALSPLSQGTFEPGNISLSFALLRLATFLGWQCPTGPLAPLPHAYLVIMAIAMPIVAIWITRRMDKLAQYSIVTISAVLFSPYCLLSYFPLLLAPGALLWRSLSQRTK